MTYRDQGLKNWTGGTWNMIKLIGMNTKFTLIHKKAQEQKWLKNETILKNLKEKKKKKEKEKKNQPCSQPRDLLMTGQMP